MTQASKICAVIQARMNSKRLPGKVLLPIGERTILEHVIRRVSRIRNLDHIVVAIPEGKENSPIENLVQGLSKDIKPSLSCFCGNEDHVLDRTLKAVQFCEADIAIRITSDCPFIDPNVSSTLLEAFLSSQVDYARLDSNSGYPIGLDTEVVRVSALQRAYMAKTDEFEKEHVTPFIWSRPNDFSSITLSSSPNYRSWRLVIDEKKDYEFAQALYKLLNEKYGENFAYRNIIEILTESPDLLEINQNIMQEAMIGKR